MYYLTIEMCGIFGVLNNNGLFANVHVKKYFMKGQKRGPEYSTLEDIDSITSFGFHRLAINGLNPESHQPLRIGDVSLICNGEIYNYKHLYNQIGVRPTTDSDCEIIIHMYNKYGMEYTLNQLDGVFAFALYDRNKLFLARDPYGVRPLFTLNPPHHNAGLVEAFASTMSSLIGLTRILNNAEKIEQFQPGTFKEYVCDNTNMWKAKRQEVYTYPGLPVGIPINDEITALKKIHDGLSSAVKKRVDATDRPIACLLSGGLDSSLITSLVKRFYKGELETYSIGLPGSEDLKYAKKVADFLGTKHTQIELTEAEFFDAIPEVIYHVESYDTTTIRASTGNYLLGKYISEHSNAKVIFNGDGSDELTGGYMYFHCAPDEQSFDAECKRLLKNIHYFDVLRSDRSISSHGLEPRTPFLDRGFVQDYLSLSTQLRFHPAQEQCEKFLLRKAFDFADNPYLPTEVLWRQKEAFSDGVSSHARSWYTIIDEFIKLKYGKKYDKIVPFSYNSPLTREQLFYRLIFNKYFPNQETVIPYFWMPQFIKGAKDSSARTLNIYKSINQK
jgi:asparagine synthase (glutamine-hydrolysing)